MTEFRLDNALGYAINVAALRLKSALYQAFKAKGYDITPEHWAVLNCLWEEEGISQNNIAKRISKDKTNLTRILDVMTKKGLIERRFHESDRRTYRIHLTEKGWEIKDDIIEIAQVVIKKARQGIEAHDEKVIIRCMDTIVRNLS